MQGAFFLKFSYWAFSSSSWCISKEKSVFELGHNCSGLCKTFEINGSSTLALLNPDRALLWSSGQNRQNCLFLRHIFFQLSDSHDEGQYVYSSRLTLPTASLLVLGRLLVPGLQLLAELALVHVLVVGHGARRHRHRGRHRSSRNLQKESVRISILKVSFVRSPPCSGGACSQSSQ